MKIPKGEAIGKIFEVDEVGDYVPPTSSSPSHSSFHSPNPDSQATNSSSCPETSKIEHDLDKELIIGPSLTPNERKQVVDLIRKYQDIIAWELSDVVTTDVYECSLDVISDIPVAYPPYRTTPKEREIVEAEVQKLLKAGKIHPSNSRYAAPCLVVSRREGTPRLVYDYRGLNKVIRKINYTTPRVDDILDCLANTHLVTTLDLRSGYFACLSESRINLKPHLYARAESFLSIVCHSASQ